MTTCFNKAVMIPSRNAAQSGREPGADEASIRPLISFHHGKGDVPNQRTRTCCRFFNKAVMFSITEREFRQNLIRGIE